MGLWKKLQEVIDEKGMLFFGIFVAIVSLVLFIAYD